MTAARGAAAPTLIRPQRHVAAAHADAGRRAPAAGLGLDSADVRARMVGRLRAEGVAHPRVLAAFAAVPRHLFVDAALWRRRPTRTPACRSATARRSRSPRSSRACSSCCSAAERAGAAGDLGAVLEIGTGCGYQAALLARLGKRVVSVERLKPLHDKARELLAPMRDSRLRLVFDDGMRGHPPGAPYDSIIAAAGGDEIPQAWLDQLAVGGRLVVAGAAAGRGPGARRRRPARRPLHPQRPRGGEVRPLKIGALRLG